MNVMLLFTAGFLLIGIIAMVIRIKIGKADNLSKFSLAILLVGFVIAVVSTV